MRYAIILCLTACFIGCGSKNTKEKEAAATTPADTVATVVHEVSLPQPYATPSVTKYADVIGWDSSHKPVAPAGFAVQRFADSLDNPRWIYQAPNGDVFVAESNSPHSLLDRVTAQRTSANRITRFHGIGPDGRAASRSIYLTSLRMPFGMLVIGNYFYVANTDGLMQYPYDPGAVSIKANGKKILELPGGPRHWTRNIIANADGSKIYIAVGSSTDHADKGVDKEMRRADILEVNADGSGEKIYAGGLRNPVGMGWAPGTKTLWTVVNERDELGDNLVPDYLTSVKEGGFYGWPYSYFGAHKDPRVKEKNQTLVDRAIVPDVALDNHSASLGLAFYDRDAFPAKYRNGVFIGQHGSWNKSEMAGYRVVFVPFKNGKPAGISEDFLTGFIADTASHKVYGRPVGVAVLQDGSLLVADDAGNAVWRVSAAK